MLPTISVITPSFQQARFLPECLASVHDQDYADLEHIVVDGGSTDGSKELIERHANDLAWWCSEKDDGQSHALNKGLQHATGDVFGWVNSDDALLPGALQRVGEAFAADPSLLVLTGVRWSRTEGMQDRRMDLEDATDPEALFVSPLINQQATFYRMRVVREAGGLEERLHCAMDYELWQQVLFRNGPQCVRVVPWDLAVFRAHPHAKTTTQPAMFRSETASVLHGLCERTGSADLARILALGYSITPGLRSIPVDHTHRARVRSMVVHFLLKWHHVVFTEHDFEMMRAFRRMSPVLPKLSPDQQVRLTRLDEQLRVPGWWAFRLRRKWEHLVG